MLATSENRQNKTRDGEFLFFGHVFADQINTNLDFQLLLFISFFEKVNFQKENITQLYETCYRLFARFIQKISCFM